MADVMAAFLSGHQAGQASTAHEQALEENKLRTMVLKHQIDGIKIENELRARTAAEQNLQLLHGQPAADLPSDPVSTTRNNLPATNLAGVISNFPGQGGASTETAPAAQSANPGINTQTAMVPRAVNIPGVPSLGVSGVSVRPKSLEDLIRGQVAAKLAEPYTLNEGASRFVGGDRVATGSPKTTVIPRGGIAEQGGQIVGRGQPVAPPRPTVVNGRVLNPDGSVAATYPPLARPADAARAKERADTRAEASQRKDYNAEVANGWKGHAEQFRVWTEKQKTAMPDEQTDPPVYTPPSFEEWQAQHPAKGAAAAAPAAGSKGAPAIGSVVTLKDGSKLKITKTYADGSFDGDPVK